MNRKIVVFTFVLFSLAGCQNVPTTYTLGQSPSIADTTDNVPQSLASRVQENIAKAGIVAPSGIWVQEEPNGIVALHGQLTTPDQVREAEQIARNTPGVTGVRNVLDDMSPGDNPRP